MAPIDGFHLARPPLKLAVGIRGHHTYFYSLFVGKSGGEVELKDRYGVP
jgi:hypothetical protein